MAYDTGVVLAFSQHPTDPTRGKLTRTTWKLDATGALTQQLGQPEVLTDRLVWTTSANRPGFLMVDVVDSGTTGSTTDSSLGTGDELGTIASDYRRANQRLKLSASQLVTTSNGTGSASKEITSVTTVSLRQTMFDDTGVKTPVINSALTASGSLGGSFSYYITASNYPTAYGASGLPAGLVLNPKTGVIAGQPTATGTSSITITAENAAGYDSKTLVLTVGGSVPLITSATSYALSSGGSLSYAILATNSPTSYAATTYGATTLPTGLSINTGTGLLSGTVADGIYTIALSATNSNGTGTANLGLTVGTVPSAEPTITSLLSATATVSQPFSYSITATNTPTTYSASGLPTGLSINSGSGLISGTPTATGTSAVTISASNSIGTGSANLSLSVVASPIPVVSAASTTAEVGSAFTYQIVATNSPTSYSLANAPTWLSVNSTTGQLSGTPTATGTSTATLRATNQYGTGTASATIVISAPTPPVVNTADTVNGSKGVSFSLTIVASNSPTSYSTVGLPAGLSCNASTGIISGTPTAEGTTSVTLKATNSAGTGQKVVSFVIGQNPVEPTISLGEDTVSGNGFAMIGTIGTNTSGTAVNYSTFTWTTNRTGMAIEKGWEGSYSSLAANQFRISKSNGVNSITVTCTVKDANNNQRTQSKTY